MMFQPLKSSRGVFCVVFRWFGAPCFFQYLSQGNPPVTWTSNSKSFFRNTIASEKSRWPETGFRRGIRQQKKWFREIPTFFDRLFEVMMMMMMMMVMMMMMMMMTTMTMMMIVAKFKKLTWLKYPALFFCTHPTGTAGWCQAAFNWP